MVNGVEYNRLDLVLKDIEGIYVDFMDADSLELQKALAKDVHSLLAALKADCAEGNMAQSYVYHSGSFRIEDDYAEKGYYEMQELGISIHSEDYTWWISIYPDSLHALGWLEAHDVLNVEVRAENIPY
jgi:hypothetical protein